MGDSDSDDGKGGKSRGSTWCAILVVLIIVVIAVIVVLALTVFRVRDPKIKVNNIQLEGYSLTFPLSGPQLSFVLGIDVDVENPNHASFKYKQSTAFLYYRGVGIGSAPVPAGKVGAQSTTTIVTEVTIDATAFANNPNLPADISAGVVPLLITTTLPGRISVINIVKRHATSTANCNLNIFTTTATVGDFRCSYKLNL